MKTASSTALTQRPAWQALETHYQKIKDVHLRHLFAADPQRGERFAMLTSYDQLTAEGYLDTQQRQAPLVAGVAAVMGYVVGLGVRWVVVQQVAEVAHDLDRNLLEAYGRVWRLCREDPGEARRRWERTRGVSLRRPVRAWAGWRCRGARRRWTITTSSRVTAATCWRSRAPRGRSSPGSARR